MNIACNPKRFTDQTLVRFLKLSLFFVLYFNYLMVKIYLNEISKIIFY